MILVDLPEANPTELAIAIGKDGKIYVVDRSNLGGLGGELGEVTNFMAPMAAKGRIYVAAKDRLSAFTMK